MRHRHVRVIGISQLEIKRTGSKPSLQRVAAGDALRKRKKDNWCKRSEGARATQVDRERRRPRRDFFEVLFDCEKIRRKHRGYQSDMRSDLC